MKTSMILMAALAASIGVAGSANAQTQQQTKTASEVRKDKAHADGSYRRAYEKRRAAERKVQRRKERHEDIVQANSAEREKANHKDGSYKRAYEKRRAAERKTERKGG